MQIIKVMRSWIKDASGAWFFYTALPGLPWPKPSFNRIARFGPLVGLLIGLIQAFFWTIFQSIGWQKAETSFITIAIGILITGGLHYDGLMDTIDGIAAGKKKCIKAMKDSRVGAIGVQSFLIIILIQISSMIRLGSLAPIAIPIATFWSRCSPLWAINNYEYLHEKESFHKSKSMGWYDAIPSVITFILLSIGNFYFLSYNNYYSLYFGALIGIIPTLIIPHMISTKIGGQSGDTLGASVVLVETLMLLILAIIL